MKILIGDNEIVIRKVCKEVGLDICELIFGYEIDFLLDKVLVRFVEEMIVFVKFNFM